MTVSVKSLVQINNKHSQWLLNFFKLREEGLEYISNNVGVATP